METELNGGSIFQKPLSAVRRSGCGNGNNSVLVDGSHAHNLLVLVLYRVLDNAQRVHPQVLKAQFPCSDDTILDGLWESANFYTFRQEILTIGVQELDLSRCAPTVAKRNIVASFAPLAFVHKDPIWNIVIEQQYSGRELVWIWLLTFRVIRETTLKPEFKGVEHIAEGYGWVGWPNGDEVIERLRS
jgi:hypothetical protein